MEIKDIKHLATLARIEVSDEEASGLLNDLTATLVYIDQIKEANVPNNEVSAGDNRNVMREDVVSNQPGEYTEMIMNDVSSKQDGFVKVNKIL